MNRKNRKRGAGVLLHISSLPNSYGIGSLGKCAYDFVDFLHSSLQHYWQILPLTPTGISNSPYQSYSAFAFNPFFIDLEILSRKGLLTADELKGAEVYCSDKLNFSRISSSRERLLRRAFSRFNCFDEDFLRFSNKCDYLDYACFMTLKAINNGNPWYAWHDEYKFKKKAAITRLIKDNSNSINYYLWLQFEFLSQWKRLKSYANSKGVKIIGDMPIYLDYDSVEAWANPRLLQLDDELKPTHVAGVPPDYFSRDGQLWGNPLYDWDFHKKSGFKWWKKRISSACLVYDYVRIDHFRGFCKYYSIPSTATSAREGNWLNAYGRELFNSLSIGIKNKIIAEDLGLLDEGTLEFFRDLDFPGMKVLQFAMDGNPSNPHLPKNYTSSSVAYTGTHDNDTLKGWFSSLDNPKPVKKLILSLASCSNTVTKPKKIDDWCMLLIDITLASSSDIAIIPMQDYLFLPSRFRMNTPGTLSYDNWSYRLRRIPFELVDNLRQSVKHAKR